MRPVRCSLLLGLLALQLTRCSLLVSDDLALVRCSIEGQIGSPSCDSGEICVAGRCRTCLDREVCDDGIDNDCNHQVDDRCAVGSGGTSGAGGTAAAASAG